MMRVNCREEKASSDPSLDGKQDAISELKTLLIERGGGIWWYRTSKVGAKRRLSSYF